LERLQGLWELKKLEVSSSMPAVVQEVMPWPPAKAPAVAILNDRLVLAGKDPEKLPVLRLDPTPRPAAIDFPAGDRGLRGGYELTGETLRICIGDGAARPARCEPGAGTVLITYQRKKS